MLAKSLSGGNLQKFMVGRELIQNPELLIVAQPTWGVDAGSANNINSGFWISSLPTINFCKFPPESDLANILLDGVCTSKSLITFCVSLSTLCHSNTI
jgi:hypothetical protein